LLRGSSPGCSAVRISGWRNLFCGRARCRTSARQLRSVGSGRTCWRTSERRRGCRVHVQRGRGAAGEVHGWNQQRRGGEARRDGGVIQLGADARGAAIGAGSSSGAAERHRRAEKAETLVVESRQSPGRQHTASLESGPGRDAHGREGLWRQL